MILRIATEEGINPPRYAHAGDAGLDLRAKESVRLRVGETVMVGTGVRMEIPTGHYGQLVMRSGFATRTGIVLAHGTGIIDSGYRGEIMLPLHRLELTDPDGTSQYDAPCGILIDDGERIAQIIIHKLPEIDVQYVRAEELAPSERGEGGFGSTGVD